jgi:hypothetical protein
VLQRRLDDYDTIRVINFIRREVAAGRDPLPALVASGQQQQQQQECEAKPWAGDEFLNPTLPDDPLITYDYEEQQPLEQEMAQLGINRWAMKRERLLSCVVCAAVRASKHAEMDQQLRQGLVQPGMHTVHLYTSKWLPATQAPVKSRPNEREVFYKDRLCVRAAAGPT